MNHKLNWCCRLIILISLSSQSLLFPSRLLDSLDKLAATLIHQQVDNKSSNPQQNEITKYSITIETCLKNPDDSTFWTIYAEEIVKQARWPHHEKCKTTIENPVAVARILLQYLQENQSTAHSQKVFIPQQLLYDLYDVVHHRLPTFHELPTLDCKLPVTIIPQTIKPTTK